MFTRGTRDRLVDTHSYECRHIRHNVYILMILWRIHGNDALQSTDCRNSIYKRRLHTDLRRHARCGLSPPECQSTSWDATYHFPGVYNEPLARKLIRGGHMQKIGRFWSFSRFSGSTHNSRQISYRWVYIGTLDHADSEYGNPTAQPPRILK